MISASFSVKKKSSKKEEKKKKNFIVKLNQIK